MPPFLGDREGVCEEKEMIYFFKEVDADYYDEIMKLRDRARYLEQEWLPNHPAPELPGKDEYDDYARHFVAVNQRDEVIGSGRLIIHSESPRGLPIQLFPSFEKGSLKKQSAEISRVIVDQNLKGIHISLGLYRIMYQYVLKQDVRIVYSLLDPQFLRVLNKYQFYFQAVGGSCYYMGKQLIPAGFSIEKQTHFEGEQPFNNWLARDPHVLS